MTTLADCWKYTFQHHFKFQSSAKTTRGYAQHYRLTSPITELGKGAWWIELQTELRGKGLKASTIHRIISAVRKTVDYTRRAGMHSVTVPELDLPKIKTRRREHASRDQLQMLMSHASEPLQAAILVSAYTGLRRGELLALQPQDVIDDCLHIGGRDDFETKGEYRVIPIHPIIKDLIMCRLSNSFLFGDEWLNSDQLYGAFKRARANAGLDRLVWHSLRHSFGSFLAEKASVDQIRALMGHKNLATSQIYIHHNPNRNRTAVLSI